MATSAAPAAIDSACGTEPARVRAESTRPIRPGGVRRCSRVIAATSIQIRLTPSRAQAASTTGSRPAVSSRNEPAQVSRPAAIIVRSLVRCMSGETQAAPAMEPPARIAISTPRNGGVRCSPWLTTAKLIVSMNPNAVSAITNVTRSLRSAAVRLM